MSRFGRFRLKVWRACALALIVASVALCSAFVLAGDRLDAALSGFLLLAAVLRLRDTRARLRHEREVA